MATRPCLNSLRPALRHQPASPFQCVHPSSRSRTTITTRHASSARSFRRSLPIAIATAGQKPTETYPKYYSLLLVAAISLGAYTQSSRIRPHQLDSPSQREPLTSATKVQITGKDHDDQVEQVSTGTNKVPYFPRTIWLPRSGGATIEGKSAALPAGIGPAREEEEYQLLGLGIRTVSFLSIQVYVVGLYVAKGDLGRLQQELVKASVPDGSVVSTLVQGERESLRKRLSDGAESEKIWEKIIKDGKIRSAFRVVPTRNTNFNHLRDGWLRGIDLRGKGSEYEDEVFKSSVNEFKGLMGGRGSVPVGNSVLLGRGARGDLRMWLEEAADSGKESSKGDKMSLLGRVEDERLSRLVWMGYLGGSKVSSEPARQSVIEGVMDVVARPSGTLETQVL